MEPNGSGFDAADWSLDDIKRYIAQRRYGGLFGSGWAQFRAENPDPELAPPQTPLELASSRTSPGHTHAFASQPLPPQRTPQSAPMVTYGALQAPLPSDEELAELHRAQEAQAARERKADIENSGFAVPALLPPLVALGLEGAAMWAGRGALSDLLEGPLDFIERDPYLRVGDNWATRAGRRAHADLKGQLGAKDGWDYEPDVPSSPKVKPDVGTPPRGSDPKNRYYLELKPDTPSGRRAAARAAKRYRQATKRPVRPIYYDPKDYM